MRIKRTKKAAWRTFDKEGVVLDTGSSKIYGLNETAARLWDLLGEDADFDELCHQFAASVDKTPPEVEADVTEFIESLQVRALVEIVT